MPIKKSAMKALRQAKKRTEQNLRVKENIAYLRKLVRQAADSKDAKSMAGHVLSTVKAIDKAIQNKVVKSNTGARMKSRLMKGLNKLKA